MTWWCYIFCITLQALWMLSLALNIPKFSSGKLKEVPYNRSAYGTKIINFHNFSYNIQPVACEPKQTVLVAVHSAVKNFKKRATIRSTWGNPRLLQSFLPGNFHVKLVFVLARSRYVTSQLLVGYEAELYNDILQVNFVDHYKNNTYKALYNLRWITSPKGCPNVKLVMKTDDDVILDFRYLDVTWRDLLNHPSSDTELLYAGHFKTGKPFRWKKSKWYLSVEAYKFSTFPPWCLGMTYFFNPSLARQIYNLSFTTPYIYTDDVYLGVLADRLDNLTRINLTSHYESPLNRHFQNVQSWNNSSRTFYHCKSHNDMYQLWAEYCFCKHCFPNHETMRSYLGALC